jgi:phosphoglycerate dehydrogenase-like enzyme
MKHVLLDMALDPRDVQRLQSLPGATIHFSPAPSKDLKERPLPAEILKGKHVLLCKRPPTNLPEAVDLEVMHIGSVGFEHLSHFKLYDSPVRVLNARGLFDTAIAEWCLSMMVNLVRDLPDMFRNQQTKTWSRDMRFHQEIRHKTVGLWGYGGIGRDTARLAKAFGMTVHVLSRSGVKPRPHDYTAPGTGDPQGVLPDRVFNYDQKNEFLNGLDFLILCLPRTANTTGIVGPDELAALPPTAWLLNVARGPIVQETALIDALKNQRLAGAALDVHYAYPLPPEHPLWEMPNVILTPHISGSELSIYFLARIGELYYQNLKRYLEREPLLNEITKEEWRETCGVQKAVFGSGRSDK